MAAISIAGLQVLFRATAQSSKTSGRFRRLSRMDRSSERSSVTGPGAGTYTLSVPRSASTSRQRRILPEGVRGISLTERTARMCLYGATRSATHAMS